MIFESEQVVWKLKSGVRLPNGPKNDSESLESEAEKPQTAKDISKPAAFLISANTSAKEQSLKSQSEAQSLKAQSQTDNGSAINEAVSCIKISQPKGELSEEIKSGEALNNSAQNAVLADGRRVDPALFDKASIEMPKWATLPYSLRKKRADVFVKLSSKEDFVESLVNYLKTKNIDVKAYDETVNYLPSDILLLDRTDPVRQGTVIVLTEGKRAVWNALLREFGDRLK